ncbi:DUF6555 family protein [Pseudomonas sp. NFIX28]|uniref:DUF6555 family protein n=1 Tax=Pseudomonas sp. NFIX28 TaxID=1566235 RepID=UPI00089AB2B7|nr:DUF6555 family protein [Pseudomonas sp. NFIX28]SDZ51684.1 hypothetical protein SAMN03159453_04293 [Pseudomonas sp. NFIX28]
MNSIKTFEIRYCFAGSQRTFTFQGARLSDSDTWYLAFLHSGCRITQDTPCGGTYRTMQTFAERSGVTLANWRELSKKT